MATSRRFMRGLLVFFSALLFIIAFRSHSEFEHQGAGSPALGHSADADGAQQQPPLDGSPLTKWGALQRNFPLESLRPLPSDEPIDIPRIQYNFRRETSQLKRTREERQGAVKEAFVHSWEGYKQYAWMKDEVMPLTGGATSAFGGWAATLVDSLDTLAIMGLDEYFDEAVAAVGEIDFTSCELELLNVFETTIRYLGGFLAAYDLSGRPILLNKAREMGEMIYKAFDTPNHMPIARWNWTDALMGVSQEAQASTLLAEIGSLSLELTRLSQLTGDLRYYDAVSRIADVLKTQQNVTDLPGMWPMSVNAQDADFAAGYQFTLGAMADSTYEYLPKEYLLLGGHHDEYRSMYESAIATAKKAVMFRPMVLGDPDILLSGSRHNSPEQNYLDPQAQHLGCYIGGMMGIAAKIFKLKEDIDYARRITDGCVWAYGVTKTGIMPELFKAWPCDDAADCTFTEERYSNIAGVDTDLPEGMTSSGDPAYKLRPEAIESVWIMYRITGDPSWMDKGWKMFQSVEKATRTHIAHAALFDVFNRDPDAGMLHEDKMESFWTAETLKYFYLLFSDPGLISLDEYVLNTEAHPLKRPVKKSGWW